MPDLQSELSKLANAWDNNTHEETNQQPKEEAVHTNTYNGRNRIREMFYDIKKNPGITKAQAVVNAMNAGGAEATAIANVSVLVRSGLVTFDGKGMTAYYPEYDPMKITKLNTRAKQRERKKIEIVKKPIGEVLREMIAQPDAVANTYVQPVMPAFTPNSRFDAEAYVNQHLTLTQAKAMFNYLKTVFAN